jgi:hypothetical protein
VWGGRNVGGEGLDSGKPVGPVRGHHILAREGHKKTHENTVVAKKNPKRVV